MQLVTHVLVAEAVLLFFYASYKYLFYSADCNPRNHMSLEANEFLNMMGIGCAYLFWQMFVLCFFWPTKASEADRTSYQKARKTLRDTESESRSTVIQDETFEVDSDDDFNDTYPEDAEFECDKGVRSISTAENQNNTFALLEE